MKFDKVFQRNYSENDSTVPNSAKVFRKLLGYGNDPASILPK